MSWHHLVEFSTWSESYLHQWINSFHIVRLTPGARRDTVLLLGREA
ncbi:Ish1 domain-containing protein [uncultured Porphyromonas sp.]